MKVVYGWYILKVSRWLIRLGISLISASLVVGNGEARVVRYPRAARSFRGL
jgi:hypothetical protein